MSVQRNKPTRSYVKELIMSDSFVRDLQKYFAQKFWTVDGTHSEYSTPVHNIGYLPAVDYYNII